MNLNKRLLKAKMEEYGDNGQTLAQYLGIARTTFSSKINETNGAEFTQKEIRKIKKRYNLKSEELDRIFFDSNVSKLDT